MPFTYLTKSTHIFFLLFLSISLMNGLFAIFSVLFLIYGVALFIFRRPPQSFRDSLVDGNDSSIFSPINGKVASIKENIDHQFFGKNLTQIHLTLPLFKEVGIYLPTTCEVIDKRSKSGKSLLRFQYQNFNEIEKEFENINGVGLILQTLKKEKMGLYIVQCKLGAFPDIGVLPGDRGLRQVNIGNIPFGGSVFVYLPSTYKVVLKEGEKVQIGVSILANNKEI